ncbi:hypothetical protein WME99_35165 [Sorangium sp. So ce136]|uniref:hypothetical protein n=1 Tax=Sorangium sp. So ce136 TaxID=3133284 RepID=UPI003F016AB0
MVMLRDELTSSEWWIKLFSALAVVGIAIVLAGGRLKSKVVIVVGMALCAPLVLGGVVMFAIGIISLMLDDKRKSRKGPNK